MRLVLTLMLFLRLAKSELVDCGDKYNRSAWDCNDYKFYFLPSNLEKTLYCIEYVKMVSPRKALESPQPVPFNLRRQIFMINEIETAKSIINFGEFIEISVLYPRLRFSDQDICRTVLEYSKLDDIFQFLPKRIFLQYPLIIKDINALYLLHDGTLFLYFIRPNVKTRCKMEFHHYPFDKHTCPIELPLGKHFILKQVFLEICVL